MVMMLRRQWRVGVSPRARPQREEARASYRRHRAGRGALAHGRALCQPSHFRTHAAQQKTCSSSRSSSNNDKSLTII